jgi:predicted negative regulator of RcsB-dependent stress response
LTDYLTEQEQIQQLKTWLKEYGPTVLLGVIIAVTFTFGYRYWQNYQTKKLLHASATYDEMLANRAQHNKNATLVQAEKLLSHYPATPYATIASMMLAREAVLKKEYPEAYKRLEWVIDHSKNSSFREIARIRVARLYLAEQKPDQALNILNTLEDKNFMGLVDEVRGDAYLAKRNPKEARAAYERALDEIPNAETARPILAMKLDNLATE